MIDTHIHSSHSQDGTSHLREYIEKAINLKMEAIGFSEHFDRDYEFFDLPMKQIDHESYFTEIMQLKEEFSDKIDVLVGAEVGFAGGASQRKILEIFCGKHLDFIINSVHLVNGEDCWESGYYKKRSKTTAYGDYLNAVYYSLDTKVPYQIVGHIGYIMRKAIYPDKRLLLKDYKGITDKIFKKIISFEKCLEINTSTRGVCDLIPTKEFLEHYYGLGGRLISFGSDAHTTGRLLENYDYAKSIAKEVGFKEFSYYKNMKRFSVPL